ncbi:hypothetical protein [Bdellovibrio sp. HCB2-146]|uniref:hypothetical protein n=1 Tax=Bdellovibrio sp. HCB2-146 TaxID=3394362 RepID=UPI0039BCAFF2
MDFASILTSLIAGGVGGNIAGSLLKKLNLGPLGNTIAGVVGGALGGPAVVNMMGVTDTATGLLGNIAGSGIGGAVVMILAGLVKNYFDKRAGKTTSTTTNITREQPPQTVSKTSPPKSKDFQDGPRP